jgi:hypothetical protein
MDLLLLNAEYKLLLMLSITILLIALPYSISNLISILTPSKIIDIMFGFGKETTHFQRFENFYVGN